MARYNADLLVTHAAPDLTDEKLDLYRRYLVGWHGRSSETPGDSDRESLQTFLYESPVHTIEFTYRTPAGELIAVGIGDVCIQSCSSVYFYFDPAESHRSLGTFGALQEIAHARSEGISHYYLGFWVNGCSAMQYKSRFRPCQILGNDGVWKEM